MKNNKLNKTISLITLALNVILMVLVSILNVIPAKYFFPILIVFICLNIFNVLMSFKIKLKKKGKIGLIILSIILSLISLIGSFYLFRTILFMSNFNFKGYTTENYSVVVLKDSPYNDIKDLSDKKIGALKNDENEQKMLEKLNSELQFNLLEYDSVLNIINDLLNGSVDAIAIEDNYKAMIEEEFEDFKDRVKTIYTFSIKYEVEDIAKDVDVTKDTFTIYIAGIDTYGEVSSISRSDVNILATINPKTNQVLLTSIPRDYYVQLHGTTGYKDKLTHAGIYGVDMSVSTIEDLLGIDINYYIRVNFTSLIKLVDALGGIDVYSEYSFDSNAGNSSVSGYHFSKGYNHVNGVQALAFARTRKAFSGGDRVRGKNQQAVIEALIRKVASPAIITRYTSILDSLEGSFDTNFSMNDITSLAKYQIDKMSSWNVTSISLDGGDAIDYTYSFPGQKLYVMTPKEESINSAKEKLAAIYNGEKLESSYGEVGNIKDPTKVEGVIPQEPTVPEEDNNQEELPNEDNNSTIPDESTGNEEESDDTLLDHIEDILGGSEEDNSGSSNDEPSNNEVEKNEDSNNIQE